MAVTQYIGSRYVPIFADPIEWSNAKEYEPLTIVVHEGNSYTSKQFVPVGIDIANESYWALTGNYNAQVEQYRRETAAAKAAADAAQESANNSQTDINELLPKSSFSSTNTVENQIANAKNAAETAQNDITETTNTLLAQINNYGLDMFLVMSRIIGEDMYPHIWLTNMQDIWIHCASLENILEGDAWNISEINGYYFITTAGSKYWTTRDFINFNEHNYPIFSLPNGTTTDSPIRAPKFHKLVGNQIIFMFGYTIGEIVNQTGSTVANTYPVYYYCTINGETVNFDSQYQTIANLPQTEGYMDVDISYVPSENMYYMIIKNERCLNTTFFKGASLNSMQEISWNNMPDVANVYLKGFEAGKLVNINGELYAYDSAYSPRTIDPNDSSNTSTLNCHFIRRALIKSNNYANITNLLWEVAKSPAALRHPCYINVGKTIVSNLLRNYDCSFERVNNYWLSNRFEHHNIYFRNNNNNAMVAFAPLPECSVRIRCATTPVPEANIYVNCDTVWYPSIYQIPVSVAGNAASYNDGYYYVTNAGFSGQRPLPKSGNFQHLTFNLVDMEVQNIYSVSSPYKIKSSKYRYLYGQQLES